MFSSQIITNNALPRDGVFAESADQQFALGTKLVMSDGRIFRYAKNAATALTTAAETVRAAIAG